MPQLFDTTEINYDRLPVPYRTKFRLYFEQGIDPGEGITAILHNNLRAAVLRVDPDTLALLPAICMWLQNYAPHNAWGSAEIVEHWAAMRRLERKKATA
jgi:hypothetical protein